MRNETRPRRAAIVALAVALLLPLALGACLAWLEPGEAAAAPVVSSDRAALFDAAVAAFSAEESGYRIGELDPDEGFFRLHRRESWRTGDEAIDVDVRVEKEPSGTGYAVVAIATRRSLLGSEGLAEPADAAPRYRDEGVEAAVLDRIRESVERFRVPRAPG